MSAESNKRLTAAVRGYVEAHDRLVDVLMEDSDDLLHVLGGLHLYQTKNNDRTLATMRKMVEEREANRHDWAEGSVVNGKEIK